MAARDDEERKYSAPALEKGLDVLELLATRGTPLTMSQIAAELNRSISELFRMVDALVHRGYVAHAASGDGFELTNKLFALGMARAPTKSLLEDALPEMRKLSHVIGQSCHLAVASDEQMVVVARIEAPGNQGFSVRVGYRRPLVESTSGLVLYAFQPESVRTEWRTRLAATTTQKAWKSFEERSAQARTQKYVKADSDVTRHIVDLSAPVMAVDGVAAALTCPYIETPFAIPVKDTIAAIRHTAAEISQKVSADENAATLR
ncbi:IclR family transcriptional regulator [Steroidobacter sp.]|uniref:IclR family transcriptional regulator n=1 Tax=Steroidobacter sp. TaxID=1978227 RepID=UPI001A3866D3|nr:IclR family transcriptional regulator [Steroidobacter sp.]MBL8269490.1 IclR family transcriptional regulator [Steroidobacter sp.]